MVRIVLCNLNLQPSERGGCERIADALAVLMPEAEVTLLHFAQIRRDPVLVARATALVLGPQGTPFAAYDRAFLPWLRALVEVFPGPVLGVCGGMQALALAWTALDILVDPQVLERARGAQRPRTPSARAIAAAPLVLGSRGA